MCSVMNVAYLHLIAATNFIQYCESSFVKWPISVGRRKKWTQTVTFAPIPSFLFLHI